MSTEAKMKWRNKMFFAGIVLAVVGVCLCQVVFWAVSNVVDEPAATVRPQTYTVVYTVTGTSNRATLTYENGSGNTEQKDVDVPWTQTYTVPQGQFVYLSAQSRDDSSRTIECQIVVNGVVVEQAESTGRFVIASCSGRAE